jgi:glycosyltransferase involved in cell wall biosynthesis
VGGDTKTSYHHFMLISAEKFEELRKIENFDLIYSESDFAIGLLKYCKIDLPLVVLHHGFYMDEVKTRFFRGDLKGKLSGIYFYLRFKTNRLQYRLLKECTRLIVINKLNIIEYQKTYPFLKEKIRLVYNGIDIDKFSVNHEMKDKIESNLGLKTDNILLYSGRIEKEKGIFRILEIFPKIVQRIHDVLWIITGDGKDKDLLLKKIKNEKLHEYIRYMGKVSYSDLVGYYNLAKIFIFPTLRYEGLPYNVIEALSCGCVVISSNFGGV